MDEIYTVLGDHPRTRIIVSLARADTPLNATEIIEGSDVSNGAFYNNIDALVESEAVVEGRKVGNSQLYDINTDNPIVAAIINAINT